MSAVKQPQYPVACPSCRNAAGWPVSAGTCDRPGVIVIGLRCRECGHEWLVDVSNPVMATIEYSPFRAYRTALFGMA